MSVAGCDASDLGECTPSRFVPFLEVHYMHAAVVQTAVWPYAGKYSRLSQVDIWWYNNALPTVEQQCHGRRTH